jgi:hypothetical protein
MPCDGGVRRKIVPACKTVENRLDWDELEKLYAFLGMQNERSFEFRSLSAMACHLQEEILMLMNRSVERRNILLRQQIRPVRTLEFYQTE